MTKKALQEGLVTKKKAAESGKQKSWRAFQESVRSQLQSRLSEMQKIGSGDAPDMHGDMFDQTTSLHVPPEEKIAETKQGDIEEALEMMNNGYWGTCVECGQKIARERLKVLLTAKTCVRCQKKAEEEPMN